MATMKLSLQPSETAVMHAAAQIYNGYLIAGKVTEGQEGQWLQRCVKEAILLATLTDKAVQSDNELG